MNFLQAAVLGLVEGITEYLPISSTGHLIIASSLMGLGAENDESKTAVDAFTIVIQGGAILAVLGLYRARFVQMLRGLFGRDNAGFMMIVNLAIAFIPAAALGLLIDDWLEARLFSPGPVIAALALGGVYMILVDGRWGGRGAWGTPRFGGGAGKGVEDLRPHEALFIGLLQCVALIPGTSRSMMTITGGYFCGLRPAAAAEFSFLLGVPTLGAACVYKLATKPEVLGRLGTAPVAVGIVVAALSAAAAVRWLVGFLARRGLAPFGWYRLVLAAALLGLIVGGVVRF